MPLPVSPRRRRSRPRSASASIAVSTAGVALVAATHVGYPAVMGLVARRAARGRPGHGRHRAQQATVGSPPDLRAEVVPMTVLIPAYNEAPFIARKVLDTAEQDYPAGQLEILVVDDGSTDGTVAEALRTGVPGLRVVSQPERGGKSPALNRGVREAAGDIVVFTDANGSLEPGSLRAILAGFDHPDVAVVSGRKRPIGDGAHGAGESLYWRYESALKAAEGVLGRVVGADGGIFAVRKSHFQDIPPGVFSDDFWIPIDALDRGLLVRQANAAVAHERTSVSKRDDFERRQRIAAGIWQVTLRHLSLAHPRRGWTAVAFTWHRLLRSVVVPPVLPLVLLASAWAAPSSRWARWLLAIQIGGYGAATVGALSNARPFAAPYQFAMANAAALGGGYRHLRRRQTGLWKRTDRGDWHPVTAATAEGSIASPRPAATAPRGRVEVAG